MIDPHLRFEEKARQTRIEVLNAVHGAGKGHIGGAFSIVDILVSLFYGGLLQFRPSEPAWEERDRFLLSKGHAGVALYAVLADLGFFPKEELSRLNRGRLLGEHPDPRIPGVEFLSGSLGHGLPVANGMALADKMDGRDRRKTIVLMGDGECYEGSVWEGAMFAAHHQLHSLCAVVDRNRLITHGSTEAINGLEPFREKWLAFGWDVMEVNAHDYGDLKAAWSYHWSKTKGAPTLLICNSVKGKGVSFMENEAKWHHGGINSDLHNQALAELQGGH